jgi:hypothetical protein
MSAAGPAICVALSAPSSQLDPITDPTEEHQSHSTDVSAQRAAGPRIRFRGHA